MAKKPSVTWLCKCGRTQPAYVLYCGRCDSGQTPTKPKESK